MESIEEMTLIDVLTETSKSAPDQGIGYIQGDGSLIFHSYPRLLQEAGQVLGRLRRSGLKAGDKLILVLSCNEDFVPAFWGCILGGIIPAPLPAPISFSTPSPTLERLHNVWQVLEQPYILLSEAFVDQRADKPTATHIPEQNFLTFSALQNSQSEKAFHEAKASDIALIQFSSGSTGRPKGVMLTHDNVLSNVRAIENGLAMHDQDIGLSWMPLYHDMGLIGFHLVPLHFQINHFLMNTSDFIRRPLQWLDSLEKHQATITAAPNFSQTMVLNRLGRKQQKKCDLACVRLILNGAEPISVPLMSRFISEMSGFGIKPQAMFPVYGLAEATLAVTFPEIGEVPGVETLRRQDLQINGLAVTADADDASVIRFANVGFPVQDCNVRIVDDGDSVLPENRLGHIQVSGENIFTDYYNDHAATREMFCDAWLRTGDMGFMRAGSLVVTGRAKDILFINGQNFFAHDLEHIAQQVGDVQAGKAAVCGCFDEQEGRDILLLFLKSSRPEKSAKLFLQVKQHLQRTTGVAVDVMIPLKSNQFPKTSSGKLQRYKLRQQYEQGLFDDVVTQMSVLLAVEQAKQVKIPPQTVNEKLMHRLWCEELVLKPEAVGIHDNFADLGGKSINAVSIIAKMESRYHMKIHSYNLAENPTIAQLAAYLDKHPLPVQGAKAKRVKLFRG
jgi:acyl-CoA synthetase (AMP-forming)/AMP-acid ligase II/acyl carrier protein